MERNADWALAFEGRTKVKQGRLGEGEADVRARAAEPLEQIRQIPRGIPPAFSGCSSTLFRSRARYQEAEQLQRQVIDIHRGLGYGDESGQMGQCAGLACPILNSRAAV